MKNMYIYVWKEERKGTEIQTLSPLLSCGYSSNVWKSSTSKLWIFHSFFFLYSKKVLSLLHELTMNVLCKSRHMYKRASKSSGKIGNKNGSFSQILKNVLRILRMSNFHCICLQYTHYLCIFDIASGNTAASFSSVVVPVAEMLRLGVRNITHHSHVGDRNPFIWVTITTSQVHRKLKPVTKATNWIWCGTWKSWLLGQMCHMLSFELRL